MNFDELIQLQVLKLKASTTGASLVPLMEGAIEQMPELRQMCAKVHPHVYDRLEQVTGLLDMSKRQFIEMAVLDAIQRAETTIAMSGALEQQRSL